MLPRQRLLAARAAYVAIVLLATLTDARLTWDPATAAERLVRAVTPSLAWRDAVDGLRNVALFAGLGAVWIVTSLSGKVAAEIRRATLFGLALSVTVEGIQVFSPVRLASIVDVTTNTLGAFGGAVSVAVAILAVRASRGARSYVGVPGFLLAGPYAGAVLCEALTPLFNSDQLRGLAGGPLGRLRVMLEFAFPLALAQVPVLDVLLFAPAGFLAVMMLAERGRAPSRAWLLVASAAAPLMVLTTLVHGMLGIPIRWEATLIDTAALGFGAWAAHRWLAPLSQALRGAARARAVLGAGAALLALWGLRPLLPVSSWSAIAAQLTSDRLIPLRSLSARVDAFSALHVLQLFLLYLPLGALLAVWPLRLRGRWAHLLPAVWLIVAVELAHLVIEGRFFDVTNVLIALAGLGMGWLVIRRSGFTPHGEALPARPAGQVRPRS